MTTIAEIQVGLSISAQINFMEIQDSFDWKNEWIFFTMKKHEQYTGQCSFPNGNNPEYFNHILPDVFGCFDLVSTHMIIASDGTRLVISKPADKQHKDRIGKLRIDLTVQRFSMRH